MNGVARRKIEKSKQIPLEVWSHLGYPTAHVGLCFKKKKSTFSCILRGERKKLLKAVLKKSGGVFFAHPRENLC